MDMLSKFFIFFFVVATKVEIKLKNQNLPVRLSIKKVSKMIICWSYINKFKPFKWFKWYL